MPACVPARVQPRPWEPRIAFQGNAVRILGCHLRTPLAVVRRGLERPSPCGGKAMQAPLIGLLSWEKSPKPALSMRHYIFMRKGGRDLACLAHVRPWVPLQAPELGHQPLLPTPSQIRKEKDIVTLACQQLCALCHRGRLPQTTPSVSFQTVPVHWLLTGFKTWCTRAWLPGYNR